MLIKSLTASGGLVAQFKGHPASKETSEQIIYGVAGDKSWSEGPNCGLGGETKRLGSTYCLALTMEPRRVETAAPEVDLDTQS